MPAGNGLSHRGSTASILSPADLQTIPNFLYFANQTDVPATGLSRALC